MPTSCISELLLRSWHPCHCSLLETVVGASWRLPLVSVAGLAFASSEGGSLLFAVCVFLLFLFRTGWNPAVLGVVWGWFGGFVSPCSRASPLSEHLGESFNLGGSRSQGCHGYLLAVPEVLSPPCLPVRHQFPSSSIGDEFNLKSRC